MTKCGKYSVEEHERRVKEKREKIRGMEAILFTYGGRDDEHNEYCRGLRKRIRSIKVQLENMTGSQI